MGQIPGKAFPWPQPYGQSPDSNIVQQAMAAQPAPQQNFLPLNPQAQQPTQLQPSQPQGQQDPMQQYRRQLGTQRYSDY